MMLLNKLKGIAIVFLICAVFAAVAFSSERFSRTIQTSSKQIEYILDAGHGNPDGGTVGSDGTTEAKLNLEIVNKISLILDKKEIKHCKTRSGEESVYTEGDTLHEKKVSDVRNRIEIASKSPKVPLISIHMNSYPDASVYGIQVFYGNGDEAKDIANQLQQTFNEQIQPTHTKVAKDVGKNVYLYSHIENPVILIECGFLSNQEELEKLKSADYREKLAKIIADVLAECC